MALVRRFLPGHHPRMKWRTTKALALAALVPMLLMAGCAGDAQPSMEPSRAPSEPIDPPPSATLSPTPGSTGPPPLSDLELSPNGLGTLVIGEPIDPALATFDPQGCRTPENQDLFADDDPLLEAWVPNYPKVPIRDGYEAYPFEPHHDDDGTLVWLRIVSPEIRTAAGIGLGSTRHEVTAAYPDAAVVPGAWATAYGIDGQKGRLVFDVADDSESLGVLEDTVWDVRVEPLEWELQSLSGSDVGAWCPGEV